MTLEEHVFSILEQIKSAESYPEVDKIISDSLNNISKNDFIIQQYVQQLKSHLDSISPLDYDSTQWSSLRYALICIRRISLSKKDNISISV